MNAVEIEQAISDLAVAPFDPAEFPFASLEAFGKKDTTPKKLRSGASNKSDLGGVLQPNHIHIKVAQPGQVAETLTALRDSPATRVGCNLLNSLDLLGAGASQLSRATRLGCNASARADHHCLPDVSVKPRHEGGV